MAQTEGTPALRDFITSDGADLRDAGPHLLDQLRSELNGNFFLFFATFFWYPEFTIHWHKPICDFIDKWGEPGWRRLGIAVPRDSGKTTCCTKANSLWQVCRSGGYNARVAIFNAKESRAKSWVGAIREFVESHQGFQLIYRDMLPDGVGLMSQRDGVRRGWTWSDSELLFVRDVIGVPEPSISAHGATGAAAGYHFTHVIKDDIIELKHALSELEMQRAKEWVDTARYLESPAEKGCDLFVYTRWSYSDVYRHYRESWPNEYRVFHRKALERDPETGEEYSSFPEKWSVADLNKMRERDPYYFACTPTGTRITMANLEMKPIEHVQVGETILGFTHGIGSRYKPARVIANGSLIDDVYEYALSDGTTLRCTPSHQWFNGKWRNTGWEGFQPYRAIGDRTKGFRLLRVHEPYEEGNADAYWLGGMFDGEGAGQAVAIAQSRKTNDLICDELIKRAESAGFYIRESCSPNASNFHIRRDHKGTSNGAGAKSSRLNVAVRLVNTCRAVQRDKLAQYRHGSRLNGMYRLKVVGERFVGRQRVYWLQTETGNYIADGCASKNSQMQSVPMAGREVAFNPDWLRYGQVIEEAEAGGDLHFAISRDHYDPAKTQSDDPAAPPRITPLWVCDRALFWDPAPSEERDRRTDTRARNGKAAVALDPWGRLLVLEARGTRQDPVDELYDTLDLALKWNLGKIAVEEVNFSKLYRHFANYLLETDPRFRRFQPQFVPQRVPRTDKDTRIRGLMPDWREGYIYLNEPECQQLVTEFREYPFGTTRDILDALAMRDAEPNILNRPLTIDEQAWYEDEEEMRSTPEISGIDSVTGY